jgi:hypothetical protein
MFYRTNIGTMATECDHWCYTNKNLGIICNVASKPFFILIAPWTWKVASC